MDRRQFISATLIPAVAMFSRPAFAAAGDQISVADSPIKNALDVYYDFLVKLCQGQGFGGSQKLLLCNTITPFDIADDTPYYSQGLFRNYADRIFSGEPSNEVGAANRADRFSYTYSDLVAIANSKVEQNHPEIAAVLAKLRSDLNTNTTELTKFLSNVQTLWKQQPESNLPDTDARYILAYLTFLNNIQYESQLRTYQDPVNTNIRDMDAVRRSVYAPWEQALLDNFDALSPDNSESRPLLPTFERSWIAAGRPKLSDLDFASPTFRVPTLFDVTPGIFPNDDLAAFLANPGSRGLDISASSTFQYTHDSQWGAGGSVSYAFFSVGASSSGSSHFAQDIQKSRSLSISFANISEILANRPLWFNPGVLQDVNVQKIVGALPGYKRLQYVSVSLIAARGLTLNVAFSSSVAQNNWTRSEINASGGISIFGFGVGGRYGSSDTQTTISVSSDGSSVTFQDGPKVCRVLGYRIEPFITPSAADNLNAKGLLSQFEQARKQFLAGKLSYIELQKARVKSGQ